MTERLLFCTSVKVTPSLVRELQTGNKDPRSTCINAFTPARRNAAEQGPVSKTEVDATVEPFPDATADVQLRNLFDERVQATLGRVYFDCFAVLDERSTRDKTLVIHALCEEPAPSLEEDPIDHSDEPVELHWCSWRVRMAECYEMLAQLEVNFEVQDDIYVGRKAEFTNAEGVFEHDRAMAWQCGRKSGGNSRAERA